MQALQAIHDLPAASDPCVHELMHTTLSVESPEAPLG